MSVRTTCPFCNAEYASDSIPTTPRIDCQRCGESFAPSEWQKSDAATPSVTTAPLYPSQSKIPQIRNFALLLLLVGGAGTAYSLLRSRPQSAPHEPLRSAAVMPPATLSGLAFLPPEASIVFACQPAAWAELSQQDPKELLAAAGMPARMLAAFEEAGVPLKSVEQIAGSFTFAADNPVPGVTLYVRFRNSGDEPAAFRNSLQAKRKPQAGRQIYTTRFSMLLMTPISGVEFLFGLTDNDLAGADHRHAGIDHFAEPIRKSISESLSPASVFWLASDDRDWSKASPLLQLAGGKKLAAKLARGRALAVGLSWEQEPMLRCSVKLTDGAASAELERFLAENLPATRTLEQQDTTITMTTPISPEGIGQLIRKAQDELFK